MARPDSGPESKEASFQAISQSAPETSGKSPFSIDDDRAQELREKCGKFRILVIGRANAGKTTILQKTCGTTDDPVIYDTKGNEISLGVLKSSALRGLHDIENEMVFKSNPGFSFHDSRGFESGGIDELENVKAFITSRSKEKKLSDQLHAIWYCIPMDDSRPFTAAEKWFFTECGTGTVPVIAIFTKFDALDNEAFRALRDEGISIRDASRLAPDRALNDFENVHLKNLQEERYPPKAHVYLRDMNQEGSNCDQLIEETAAALNNEALQQLFVSTQRNSLELCMQYAIKNAVMRVFGNHYKDPTLKPDDFKWMVEAILTWFPQYSYTNKTDDIDVTDYGRFDAGVKIYSRLYSFPIAFTPIQRLVHLGIVTAIMADFEYLIWNAGYKDTLTKALAVYEKHASTQATTKSVEEALKSFDDHNSKEELSQQVVQIALEHRLAPELLGDPVVTK